eukprot:14820-Heterococcus_DN1.PRE.7
MPAAHSALQCRRRVDVASVLRREDAAATIQLSASGMFVLQGVEAASVATEQSCKKLVSSSSAAFVVALS